jgi:orotidine-5'-phosphate decarboxylase
MTKLIVSLDKLTSQEVTHIIETISKNIPEYKTEILYKFNDMIALLGFQGIYELVKDYDIRLMLDPKWNDIPNTMRNYFIQLEKSGLSNKVDIVTVHANAGPESLKQAWKTRNEFGGEYKIFAITALTSLGENDVQNIYDENAKHAVLKLTKLALDAGVDGIVCS